MDKSQANLQRYISQAGYCSRRKAALLIAEGKVKLNGIVCLQAWQPVEQGQKVEVEGVNIRPQKKQLYFALHKPPGYLSSNSDPHGRPCAIALIQPLYSERLFHVGRLDKNSSGLLFFTNDGYFAQSVQHPSNAIEKEYQVKTRKNIPEFVMQHWMRGIKIDGQHYKLQNYHMLGGKQVQLILTEGLNREIRRVFEHFHIPLKRVHRLRIGKVRLHGLSPGEFRVIKGFEVKSLLEPPTKHLNVKPSPNKHAKPNGPQRGLYSTPSKPYNSKQGTNSYGNTHRRRPQLSSTKTAPKTTPKTARPQRKRSRHA